MRGLTPEEVALLSFLAGSDGQIVDKPDSLLAERMWSLHGQGRVLLRHDLEPDGVYAAFTITEQGRRALALHRQIAGVAA